MIFIELREGVKFTETDQYFQSREEGRWQEANQTCKQTNSDYKFLVLILEGCQGEDKAALVLWSDIKRPVLQH